MILRNTDMNSFIKNIGDKRIIGFGCGYNLYAMINMYPEIMEKDLLEGIVDNDEFIIGITKKFKGKNITIEHPDRLKKNPDGIVIMIFANSYYQIVEQLDTIKELEDEIDFFRIAKIL